MQLDIVQGHLISSTLNCNWPVCIGDQQFVGNKARLDAKVNQLPFSGGRSFLSPWRYGHLQWPLAMATCNGTLNSIGKFSSGQSLTLMNVPFRNSSHSAVNRH